MLFVLWLGSQHGSLALGAPHQTASKKQEKIAGARFFLRMSKKSSKFAGHK